MEQKEYNAFFGRAFDVPEKVVFMTMLYLNQKRIRPNNTHFWDYINYHYILLTLKKHNYEFSKFIIVNMRRVRLETDEIQNYFGIPKNFVENILQELKREQEEKKQKKPILNYVENASATKWIIK